MVWSSPVASLSTEKGKPRGIIPQEIGFAGSEIGGTNSPTWYTANHTPGTVNYDWRSQYHDYIVRLLLFAHKRTGDAQYLGPMDLTAEFVRRHMPKNLTDSPLWKNLPEGSDEWVAAIMADWPEQWEKTQRVLFPEKFDSSQESYLRENVMWCSIAVAL